jgi:hypothetical protein
MRKTIERLVMHLSADKKNIEMTGVYSEFVDSIWTQIVPLLEKAMAYADGKYSVDDVYRALREKDMQLWIAYLDKKIVAFAITQILIYPQTKRLCVTFMGGEKMSNWLHYLKPITDWAKSNGCEAIEGYSRPGVAKAIKNKTPFDFEVIHTVIRAKI